MKRRSFIGAISLGLAAIACKFKPAPKRVGILDSTVAEWQQGVLRRNFRGANTGSSLMGLLTRLKEEEYPNHLNWFNRS